MSFTAIMFEIIKVLLLYMILGQVAKLNDKEE